MSPHLLLRKNPVAHMETGVKIRSTAKVTIELKKKGSRGKLPFGEKGVNHENPTGIVLGKWSDLSL